MSELKKLFFVVFFYIISFINSSRVIVLPIYYASPNEPNQFEVNAIIDFYSKNDIYTSFKMGSPSMDLEVLLDDQDTGFIIKEGKCISGSDYKIKRSDTFRSGDGLWYQSINNELTVIRNSTSDRIELNEASTEYFYSSLKNRRYNTNMTKISVDDFSFLYVPNSEEVKEIEEKIVEKRKREREKEKEKKKRKKNKDKNDKDKEKDKEKDKKDDDKDDDDGKKKKKKGEYGDDYYPDYGDFFEPEEEDVVDKSGFGPYYQDDDNNNNPWNDMYMDTNKKCAFMGLLPPGTSTGLTNSKLNFIQQLKNKKIINNYNWYIRFNKDKTGEMIIGAAPHEIKPENYFESDLYMTHARLINDAFYWEIQFNAIYLNDNASNKRINLLPSNGIISMNDNFIYSTKDYFNNITSIYFEQYFKNNKCKIEVVEKKYERPFVIYCHKNFTNEDMQKFPMLSLQSSDLNFVFNLDYNDLFLKTKGKYIFKIIFNGQNNYWKLGKTFLEKYQFVFNYDSKMFGFYQKFIPENIEGDINYDYIDVIDKNKKKQNDKLPPSKRKEMREKNKMLNEKTDYMKIVIIVFLVLLITMLSIYILRRFIFSKQINSKVIENYGKFNSKGIKNKINRLTEEYSNEENI